MTRFDPSGREYLKTHPWIAFDFRVDKLAPMNWMRIGEAISKCDHIAGVPLAPATAAELHKLYLAKGVHATTQIEGNTLSEDEVRARLDGKLDLPESQEYLGIEADNIAEACDTVIDDLLAGSDLELRIDRIKEFHKIVMKGLPPEEGLVPGEIRTGGVWVGNVYRGPPARDCEFLLAKLCDWLNALVNDAEPRLKRPMKILRAMIAHLYIAWIHPFQNGNGRTARLVEFQLLLAAGLPTPVCHLLANYYNRTRSRYYDVLRETSRREPYTVAGYVSYALDGFVEELRSTLNVVRGQQMLVTWTNFVHDIFRHQPPGPPRNRQRELVLSLPYDRSVPVPEVRRLTASLAEQYADKQQKTVTRDINALETLGLIERTNEGIRPMIEIVSAFLPIRQQV